MQIKIKRMHNDAKMPNYSHKGDAGMDMYSLEDADLKPGERKIFFTGFALEFKDGYVAIVKDKSGLAKNHGIHTMGGVFDSGYRGEYNVNLINLGQETYHISKGDKIAQLIILPIVIAKLKEVEKLNESSRNEGRFGSTGK